MATTEQNQSGTYRRVSTAINSVTDVFSFRRVLAAYSFVIGLYVYLPLLTLIAFSFNAGGLSFPFTDFTFEWYTALLGSDVMINNIVQSLKLAFVVMIITTVLATMALLAYRREFRGKNLFLYLIILGIITPGITYGIGASILLNEILGIPQNLWAAIPVHVVWTFPFSFIILLAGTPGDLAKHEEAARMMGASKMEVWRKVIFPQINTGVLGAAVFALTLSYNEGTRAILLLGSDSTLPQYIFTSVAATAPTPRLFALGSVTTAASMFLLAFAFIAVLVRSA